MTGGRNALGFLKRLVALMDAQSAPEKSREQTTRSGIRELSRLAVHDLDKRAKPSVNVVAEDLRRMPDFKDNHHR
jgi:hypothetical protein